MILGLVPRLDSYTSPQVSDETDLFQLNSVADFCIDRLFFYVQYIIILCNLARSSHWGTFLEECLDPAAHFSMVIFLCVSYCLLHTLYILSSVNFPHMYIAHSSSGSWSFMLFSCSVSSQLTVTILPVSHASLPVLHVR